ncbi:GntR family transcriptional regulator [Pseudoflavonifractor sp. 524-17]|uniref:GntR family transcriptional regulator n=1 Tax=Pseudoflavonifractor sp. 524-17 TaxID=2304577 RepID=UPI001379C25E|nr:GntR family transcriptional regulator [Pseudoflavonifractor sp. 524-17]NCE66163.1 GntR family transcriptional regulator [Pseudoflavonifractor sp. 524-17]
MGNTNLSTYMAVKRQLLEIFRTERFPGNKLPSEEKLAQRLGISLVTLREGMLMLALEGYITKRHGVGNFVHPSVLDPTNHLDLGFSFADGFRQSGREPGIKTLYLGIEPARGELARRLDIPEGENLQRNEMLYTADGAPGVFTVSRLPFRLIRRPFRPEEHNWYVHESIWDHCGIRLAHSINDYRALAAGETAAEYLKVPVGTPLLYCEQLFYDQEDRPVLLNIHHFHPQNYGMRTIQNWDVGPGR